MAQLISPWTSAFGGRCVSWVSRASSARNRPSNDDLAFDDRSASAFYKSYLDSGGVIEPPHLFSAALFHALRYVVG